MENRKLKSRIITLICLILMIPFLGQCDKQEPISSFNNSSEASEVKDQNKSLYAFFETTVKPVMIKYETPSYPVEARKNGIGGKVVVTVIIDEEGNVSTAKILSSDNIVFDEAALEAAKKSKFKPGEVDGVSVKVNMNIPYNFMLK